MEGNIEIYGLTEFEPYVEPMVRALTMPDGLPQDRLAWADYQFVGKYGLSCQFRWASGRQDVRIWIDIPPEMEALNSKEWHDGRGKDYLEMRETLRQRLIAKTKGVNHGKRAGESGNGDSCDLRRPAAY